MLAPMTRHPKGSRARVLLTSVFGPYAQDDRFGSRAINPMELYHNQVTRAQGSFSLRMFHRSWGITLIQANIPCPTTLLDFPTQPAFERELLDRDYDIVGISSIIVNVGKVAEMCRTVRRLSPRSTIVVGGHVTAIPGVEDLVDADHFVRGDGIAWMRQFVGADAGAPIVHPEILSGFGHRALGLRLPRRRGSVAATLIPSVGCPLGCNFCTTSAFFGGKGRFVNFYDTGAELYDVMCALETRLGVHAFFVMDENFLLHRRRALELLELMERGGKSWELYLFSSANALRKYSMEELVALGVSWVWMGLESPGATYAKLNGIDTRQLIRDLRSHGIRVLGSSIVGLEHHTPENIREEIESAVSHDTDFHQFMLYTPVPGTPLHAQMAREGRLLDVDLADIHGQDHFNFRHAAISREASKPLLDWAFERDFEANGPSLYRICRTAYAGWLRHGSHRDPRIRARFAREAAALKHGYAAMLWAMEHQLARSNAAVAGRIRGLRLDLARSFGTASSLVSRLLGPALLYTTRREEARLARGVTYEPPTIVERRNWA